MSDYNDPPNPEPAPETPPWLIPEDDSSISKQGLKTSRMIMMAASSIAILLFGGAIWYFYTQSGTEDNGEVPLIEAPDGPDKVEPEDVGGLDVPDQDKLVFDVVSGDETELEDEVTDAPEEPMDRPGAPCFHEPSVRELHWRSYSGCEWNVGIRGYLTSRVRVAIPLWITRCCW